MVNYTELAKRLATSVREGNKSEDNARRIWEIWTQTTMFDERDRFYNFSLYSGLPDGIVGRYMEVCKLYQTEISYTDRPAKQHRPKP